MNGKRGKLCLCSLDAVIQVHFFWLNSYLLLLIGVFVRHLILFIEVRIGNNVSRSFGIGHLVS